MADETVIDDDLRARARADSDRASARAGVEVRELVTVEEFTDACAVWDAAWPQPRRPS